MKYFKSQFPIQLVSTVVGMSSLMASLPALADTPSSTTGLASANTHVAQVDESETQEEELSPEVMKILCKNFPLNSRCSGTSQSDTVPPSDDTSDLEGAADTPESVEPENSEPEDSTVPEMDSSDTESEEAPVDSSSTDDMDEPTEGGAAQPDGTMTAPEEVPNPPETMTPDNTTPVEPMSPNDPQGTPTTPPMVPVPEGGTE
ncbi:hypothetical protein AM1_6062 [Acaryochloris marina MBIC11017]|uniref:Uncharacterized protein n=2 Tax=Acaryochloris marina TaxID=155978 RepID=B0C3Q7_ACAM1|nr:hypothetical protein [Acaryochloris marina]ABW30994.1 hypothetical protein AM1_6062 [Acaryochloris marina MBIC11017]